MLRFLLPAPLAALLAVSALAQDEPLFVDLHLEMSDDTGVSIAAGDLDLDDRVDLVIEHAGSLRPLAGRGDGSFLLDETLDVPGLNQVAATRDLAVADVDGDGVPDVLASGGPFIDVLIGHGDLTFSAAFGAIDAINDTAQLAVLDLDGDGDTDVAAGNAQDVRITVHLNGGAGAFLRYTDYGPVPQGHVTAAGDWDLDGDPDLLFGELDADGLDLLFNDGAGGFGAPVPILIAAPVSSVTAGDLDADGDADLVACVGVVRLFEGNGLGGFVSAGMLVQGPGAACVAVSDMDEDGHADILVSGDTIALHPGHGGFGFDARIDVPAGQSVTEFVLGDFDRDGETDIAAEDAAFDGVTVALGRDGSAFSPSVHTSGPSQRVSLADFDHDGRLDLVSANAGTPQGGCRLTLARGVPQGAFELVADLPAGNVTTAVPAGLWTGPLDDDGDADIVLAVHDAPTQALQVRLGDGALGFGPTLITTAPSDLRGLDAADFDLDGHTDLITTRNALDQDVVWFGHGDGTFEPPLLIDTGDLPDGVVTGDWNGDGLTDFATVHASITKALRIHFKAAGPGFLQGAIVEAQLLNDGAAAGDLDLDGDLDLAAGGEYVSGGGSIFLNDGAGTFDPQPPLGVEHQPVGWAIGDVDHNGWPDLVVAQKHSAENEGGVAFLPGLGHGNFGAAQEFALPASAADVALGDLDLDGVPDAVVATNGGQAVTALLSLHGPWDDLQHPLAGALGYASFTAEGTLEGGAPFALRLADAPPLAAVLHVVGLVKLDAPFKGGVLVPAPGLLNGPLAVAADGTIELTGSWPTVLPSGLKLYMQCWWADPGGPKGFAASRALRATLP